VQPTSDEKCGAFEGALLERRQRAAALDGDGVEVDYAIQAGQDVAVRYRVYPNKVAERCAAA